MKKYFIILCLKLLIALINTVHAQNPGYLGKKYALGIETFLSPRTNNPGYFFKQKNGINISTGINFQYTISKYFSFTTSLISFYTGIVDLQKNVAPLGVSDVMFFQMNNYFLSSGFLLFSKQKGAISPIGKYVKAEIIYSKNTFSSLNYYEKNNYSNSWFVGFSLGNQMIIKNNILLGAGVRSMFSPFTILYKIIPGINAESSHRILRIIDERVTSAFYFSAEVRVSYLF